MLGSDVWALAGLGPQRLWDVSSHVPAPGGPAPLSISPSLLHHHPGSCLPLAGPCDYRLGRQVAGQSPFGALTTWAGSCYRAGPTRHLPGLGCTAARTACGWGFCPLGDQGSPLPLPRAQRLWLRVASLLRFLWPVRPQDGHRGPHLGSRPRTGSGPDAARCQPSVRSAARGPALSVSPWGAIPVPFSKAELLLMLQDVVSESPLPEGLP